MKKLTLFFILLIAFGSLYSQEKTEECYALPLVTDRPDQTESSITVPVKQLQIESGFMFETDEFKGFRYDAFAYNSTLLRYGLVNGFELRLGIEYMSIAEEFKSKNYEKTLTGFTPLTVGMKVFLFEEKGLRPEASLLGHISIPDFASEDFKGGLMAHDFIFSFSHTISNKLSFGYNLGAEWDGVKPNAIGIYSGVIGVGLHDKVGFFIESYGRVPEGGGRLPHVGYGLYIPFKTKLSIRYFRGYRFNR
jgi:hypothetical protein